MGAGQKGNYGQTAGSAGAGRFKRVTFSGTVKVDGETRDVSRKVYQRGDIDFDYIDPKTGKTNLALMRSGRPPIGNDGRPIELHHVIQKESGPVVEIRETTHREYSHQLHGLVGKGDSFRNDTILGKQYNNFRKAYWKWRAEEYMRRKKR